MLNCNSFSNLNIPFFKTEILLILLSFKYNDSKFWRESWAAKQSIEVILLLDKSNFFNLVKEPSGIGLISFIKLPDKINISNSLKRTFDISAIDEILLFDKSNTFKSLVDILLISSIDFILISS